MAAGAAFTADGARPEASEDRLSFDVVYDAHFAFVWRAVRRLGVDEAPVGDVVQETFVVVHKRLSSYAGDGTLRAWLYSIVKHVVRNHRRSLRRKPGHLGGPGRASEEIDALAAPVRDPLELAVAAEATRTLHAILQSMPMDRREVFVLADLEQMPVHEIARAVGANVNTIHARLRAARAEFERAAARARARDGWRAR